MLSRPGAGRRNAQRPARRRTLLTDTGMPLRIDFTALSKRMDDDRTPVRTLRSLRVLRVPHGVRVVATADGFLYGMVRLLAGLLLDVGRGKRAPDSVPALLASADRSRAPPSLPPQGLFLWRVRYGGDPFARLLC